MRPSTFYMGKLFTSRHLSQVRSPLMKGFVSPLHSSFTQGSVGLSALAITQASGLTTLSSAAVTGGVVPQELALQLQAMASQLQQSFVELVGLQSVVTFILARACWGFPDHNVVAIC